MDEKISAQELLEKLQSELAELVSERVKQDSDMKRDYFGHFLSVIRDVGMDMPGQLEEAIMELERVIISERDFSEERNSEYKDKVLSEIEKTIKKQEGQIKDSDDLRDSIDQVAKRVGNLTEEKETPDPTSFKRYERSEIFSHDENGYLGMFFSDAQQRINEIRRALPLYFMGDDRDYIDEKLRNLLTQIEQFCYDATKMHEETKDLCSEKSREFKDKIESLEIEVGERAEAEKDEHEEDEHEEGEHEEGEHEEDEHEGDVVTEESQPLQEVEGSKVEVAKSVVLEELQKQAAECRKFIDGVNKIFAEYPDMPQSQINAYKMAIGEVGRVLAEIEKTYQSFEALGGNREPEEAKLSQQDQRTVVSEKIEAARNIIISELQKQAAERRKFIDGANKIFEEYPDMPQSQIDAYKRVIADVEKGLIEVEELQQTFERLGMNSEPTKAERADETIQQTVGLAEDKQESEEKPPIPKERFEQIYNLGETAQLPGYKHGDIDIIILSKPIRDPENPEKILKKGEIMSVAAYKKLCEEYGMLTGQNSEVGKSPVVANEEAETIAYITAEEREMQKQQKAQPRVRRRRMDRYKGMNEYPKDEI